MSNPNPEVKPRPVLSDDARTMLDAFRHEPGVTAQHSRNLMASIAKSPVLIEQINAAVAAGELKKFVPLAAGANASGEYDGDSKTMGIDLPMLKTPRQGRFFHAEPIAVLGHELRHAFNDGASDRAYEAFDKAVKDVAGSREPIHDYTRATADMIAANRKDEAGGEIGSWNAIVSMVRESNPHPTLKDLYLAHRSQMSEFIDVGAARPPTYTMKPGFTLNADLSITPDAANLEAAGRHFFDRPPAQTGIGARGNSDYANYYGSYLIGVIAEQERALAKPLFDGSMPQVHLDMRSLKLNEPLLEQNGIDLGGAGKTQTIFDSGSIPPTPHRFDHTEGTYRYMPKAAHEGLRSPADPTASPATDLAELQRFPGFRQAFDGLSRSPNIPVGTFDASQMPVVAASVAAHALGERVEPESVLFDKQRSGLIAMEGRDPADPSAKLTTPLPVAVALGTTLGDSLAKLEHLERSQTLVESTGAQVLTTSAKDTDKPGMAR